MTSLLCEQVTTQSRGSLFACREGYFGRGTTWKLPHYFQAHILVVLTQHPLQSLLRKADYIGRISKHGTILRAFDIK